VTERACPAGDVPVGGAGAARPGTRSLDADGATRPTRTGACRRLGRTQEAMDSRFLLGSQSDAGEPEHGISRHRSVGQTPCLPQTVRPDPVAFALYRPRVEAERIP